MNVKIAVSNESGRMFASSITILLGLASLGAASPAPQSVGRMVCTRKSPFAFPFRVARLAVLFLVFGSIAAGSHSGATVSN